MNVTELARIIRVTPQELRDLLPLFGFHIGQKAIKIDGRLAQKIIKEWPMHMKAYEEKKRAQALEAGEILGPEKVIEKKNIKISKYVTVREFAGLAQIPVSKVLAELMKNGVFTSMNERIDFDTASVIGADLNLNVEEQTENPDADENTAKKNKISDILSLEKTEEMITRAPVIVVMGHVDHGKTKLLDAIRRTNIVAGEAGGITQHIGAYQVVRKNKLITFIDTPGHEAFTAMRSRGAKIADIAILVVAADDGVKPQTVEAFRIIEAAKLPFIVAINKIDKPGADINKTKQELSTKLNITPEDWGGKTVCVPVSALKGEGMDDILDMILLTTEMEQDTIKSNPNTTAVGTVVESHIDKGAGAVATILIQNGTLRIGDQLVLEGNSLGKVKALKNYKGENITEAGPSVPAEILGLKIAPEVGDVLEVGEGERIKTNKFKSGSQRHTQNNCDNEIENNKIIKFNLIIKSDVLGSTEAIEESLEKICTEDVRVKIIYRGLGNIIDGDVIKAEGAGAQIVGFNVKINPQTEEVIREKNIKVHTFKIIYDLIDYVKNEMQALIVPEVVRVSLGKLKVLAVFRSETAKQVIGGKVLEGKITADSIAEITRDKQLAGSCQITRLQSGKQDVKEVEIDQECGLQCEGKNAVIQEGDILQVYKEEKIIKKI